MTRMRDLISEATIGSGNENRVSLMKVEIILEGLVKQLSEKEQEKLAEVYVQLKFLGEGLNTIPRTAFNGDHWRWMNFALMGKIAEMRMVVEDISSDNKEVDCRPLMGALDLLLTQ